MKIVSLTITLIRQEYTAVKEYIANKRKKLNYIQYEVFDDYKIRLIRDIVGYYWWDELADNWEFLFNYDEEELNVGLNELRLLNKEIRKFKSK